MTTVKKIGDVSKLKNALEYKVHTDGQAEYFYDLSEALQYYHDASGDKSLEAIHEVYSEKEADDESLP